MRFSTGVLFLEIFTGDSLYWNVHLFCWILQCGGALVQGGGRVAAPRDERVSAFGICGKVMLLFKCTVSRQEAGPITGFVLKIDVSKGKLVLLVCEKVEDKQDVPTVQG